MSNKRWGPEHRVACREAFEKFDSDNTKGLDHRRVARKINSDGKEAGYDRSYRGTILSYVKRNALLNDWMQQPELTQDHIREKLWVNMSKEASKYSTTQQNNKRTSITMPNTRPKKKPRTQQALTTTTTGVTHTAGRIEQPSTTNSDPCRTQEQWRYQMAEKDAIIQDLRRTQEDLRRTQELLRDQLKKKDAIIDKLQFKADRVDALERAISKITGVVKEFNASDATAIQRTAPNGVRGLCRQVV